MTYEEFINTADQHINEVVRFTVLFKVTGETRTMERVNYEGKKGWVESNSGSLTEVIEAQWTGRVQEPILLSEFMA